MMKHKSCENEAPILEALGQGVATEAMEEPLRRHILGCASCAEVVSVYKLFQNDREQLSAAVPLPNADRIWWRAAAERALRPILIVEKAALATGGGVLLALLVLAAPWLAEHVRHSNVFTGNVVYSFPLSFFIVTSVVACLLLMAGALYTVWTEK
ncbi:MAG TPA: hypothetical protein VFJ52_03170, partial [Terriglobia bacterium]|nr:hypothetical protein [Terriglobia bacterium]